MAFMLLLFVVCMLIVRNVQHISDFMTVIEVLIESPPDTKDCEAMVSGDHFGRNDTISQFVLIM